MNYRNKCNTLWKGNALELISEVFHKVKIKMNKKSYSSLTYLKVYSKLYDFYHIYKYCLGTLTNTETRSYFIEKQLNDYFIDMRDELIPLFLRELLNSGLISIAERSVNKLNNYFEDIVNHFKTLKDDNGQGISDMGMIRDHPIIHGIHNRLCEIPKSLESIMTNSKLDLIEAMNSMRVEKIDAIVLLKRDTSSTIRGITNL